MKLLKYKIYCETDTKFEYVILEETASAPTTCPVNTNHICSADSVAIHEIIDLSVKKTDITSIPSSTAKTTNDGKKLFKRVHGIRSNVVAGNNVVDFIVPYPHVKIKEIQFFGADLGEYVELEIFDTAVGTYTGVPNFKLNQFGFSANIANEFYTHKSEFDADLYQGMIVKITYYSINSKNIGINYVMDEVK